MRNGPGSGSSDSSIPARYADEEITIENMSKESYRDLNNRLEDRTKTRIDYWLDHESMSVSGAARKHVGCIYHFTTKSESKAVQLMNNWVTVFNALR
jgi:hypothetical protein